MRKSFGEKLKLGIRGASHAPRISFELEGFPKGFKVDIERLSAFLERRAPGRDAVSTARREPDVVVFDRGIDEEGRATGEVIAGHIANTDARPEDYGSEQTIPRPGHADFPQWVALGRMPTGGGTNSGRLTVAMCAAGGLAIQFLEARGIHVAAKLESVGGHGCDLEATILAAKNDSDSVGGIVSCTATGLPPGLGGALFDGIESELSAAIFAIPGVKGVEFGNGFASASLRGSQNNDPFLPTDNSGRICTDGNNHGGILGGRTSGMPITMRVAFKPTPTIFRLQPSVDLATGAAATCESKGRHDPCIARRAVPVVEAAVAFVIADILLATEADTPRICLTLTGKTIEEDLAQLASQRFFTDIAELRVDLLDPIERSCVAAFPARAGLPTILTFRRKIDGGAFDGADNVRAEFFRSIITPGCGFAFVDFEDDFRYPDLVSAAHNAGVRIIRSEHRFSGPMPDIAQRLRELRGDTDEIPKLAFMPESLADVAHLFDATSISDGHPRIVCAMGPLGLPSRILASRTHSFLTYASVAGLSSIGHLSPYNLVRTYRLRSLPSDAALYGVTGYPLVFTHSPELHNDAFAAADEDALMIPFPSRTAEEALAFMRALDLHGLAVTYPHKQSLIPLLDRISPEAAAIGAVNTVAREGDVFVGYNTDATGFTEALRDFLGTDALAGRRAAVVGAGGAARAVVYALRQMGADICIFNRTLSKAKSLADDFDCKAAELGPQSDAMFTAYADIVIQCAAPGADPKRFDPLAFHVFTGREWVYDLVYEPESTPTLERAKAAGCHVRNGFSMLAAQARNQRRIWGIA